MKEHMNSFWTAWKTTKNKKQTKQNWWPPFLRKQEVLPFYRRRKWQAKAKEDDLLLNGWVQSVISSMRSMLLWQINCGRGVGGCAAPRTHIFLKSPQPPAPHGSPHTSWVQCSRECSSKVSQMHLPQSWTSNCKYCR